MSSDLQFFLTETLYAIPEKMPFKAQVKSLQAVLVDTSPENQETETIIEPVEAASDKGFGKLGYQITSQGSCNTILITSIEPELFDEIPSFGFLPKLLQAVGEEAGNVCYLNLAPDKEQVTELQLLKNYKHALVFLNESHPFAKRLKLTPYEPKKFQQMNTVLANELLVIEKDRNLKTRLWQALQSMYLTK